MLLYWYKHNVWMKFRKNGYIKLKLHIFWVNLFNTHHEYVGFNLQSLMTRWMLSSTAAKMIWSQGVREDVPPNASIQNWSKQNQFKTIYLFLSTEPQWLQISEFPCLILHQNFINMPWKAPQQPIKLLRLLPIN